MTAALAPRPVKAAYRCAICHRIVTDRIKRPAACDFCGSEASFCEIPPELAKDRTRNVHALSVMGNVRRIHATRLRDCDVVEVPRLEILSCIDHVLGGSDDQNQVVPGVALGTVVRIEAEPGAGKSTLCLQALGNVAQFGPVVYGTGEETLSAVRTRAQRLGVFDEEDPDVDENLMIVPSTTFEDFLDEIKIKRPLFAVYDSAQVARSRTREFPPGSPMMIAYVMAEAFELAHKLGDVVIAVINQMVKDGTAAGPAMAGHAVDELLRLRRDEDHEGHDDALCPFVAARYLTCGKNRHGPETRTARLAMTARGLVAWERMYPAPVTCQQPAAPRKKRAAQSGGSGPSGEGQG